MSMLTLATDYRVPVGILVDAIAILARRGAGKTYTGNVLVEEAIEHKVPTVVLDPTGVWWGLRSSADGKKPGYPVVILGGEHGDVALEPTAGKVIADLVVDQPGAYVIDLSGFESNAAQDRFAIAFAERLYRRKAKDRSPLCLVVDEADSFAPQRPAPGQQAMLGAFEAIVRRGRSRGLGVVLISQRAAVVNKNVLTQCEILLALQTTGTQDRAAVLDWVKGRGAPEEVNALSESLASLKIGQAWLWSPQLLQCFRRIHVRKRRTYDSSATPRPGETTLAPTAFAPVDLDALGASIAATIEKAKADDPKALRDRIRELERQLAAREPERVEVPVFDADLVVRLDDVLRGFRKEAGRVVDEVLSAASLLAANSAALPVRDISRSQPPKRETSLAPDPETPAPRTDRLVVAVSQNRRGGSAPSTGGPALDKASRAVLSVLAQYPDGRTHRQLALLAGYSPKASTISVALSKLRARGYVTPGGIPKITDAGLAVATVEPLPTGAELLAYWRANSLLGKAERSVLDVLVAEYPREVSHAEMCERTGYSPDASTISVAMSKLRKLELADGWKAADDFMAAIT